LAAFFGPGVLGVAKMSAKLITVSELAERLRCSRWGIYAMVRDGRLRAVRLSGRRLLFNEMTVEEAIRRAEKTAAAEKQAS
jgi:excisionase family DNA binding protein